MGSYQALSPGSRDRLKVSRCKPIINRDFSFPLFHFHSELEKQAQDNGVSPFMLPILNVTHLTQGYWTRYFVKVTDA